MGRALTGLLLTAGLLLGGCSGSGGGGGPSDPGPSGPTLTLAAEPTSIGPYGETLLTARARAANGQPVAEGQVIELATNLGILLDPAPRTDSQGVARARLRGDGRTGTARLTGRLGGTSATASLDLPIGLTVRVEVRAAPTSIPTRGTSLLTITARRADATPFPAGTRVALTATLGRVLPTEIALDGLGSGSASFEAGSAGGVAEVVATITGQGSGSAQIVVGGAPTVTLSAAPSSIPVDGRAELVARVLSPQGQPLDGLEVLLTTTLGRLEGERPRTDAAGFARSALVGEGTAGEARVAAQVIGSASRAETVVRLGSGVRLVLVANPTQIAPNGEALLGVTVSGADGSPRPSVTVALTTTLGTVAATPIVTDSLGVATTTLRGDGRTGTARVNASVVGGDASDAVEVVIAAP